MRRSYFDHNASSPMRPEVRMALEELWNSGAANPSSIHAEGRRARQFVENAREQVAALLQVLPQQILLLSGGTEACNLAAQVLSDNGSSTLLRSALEHPALAQSLDVYGRTQVVPCGEQGAFDASLWEQALRKQPVAGVAHMLANNETGIVYPVPILREMMNSWQPKALLFCDAVQAVGKLPWGTWCQCADLLAGSGHKLGGIAGGGFLFVRSDLKANPRLRGGGQERGWRGGTESLAALVAMGAAAAVLTRDGKQEQLKMAVLRNQLQEKILQLCPEAMVQGANLERLPNTLCISFPRQRGDMLVMGLDMRGVAASTGSACASGATETSKVLQAMGVPEELARGTVRFSLGHNSTTEQVQHLLDALAEILP